MQELSGPLIGFASDLTVKMVLANSRVTSLLNWRKDRRVQALVSTLEKEILAAINELPQDFEGVLGDIPQAQFMDFWESPEIVRLLETRVAVQKKDLPPGPIDTIIRMHGRLEFGDEYPEGVVDVVLICLDAALQRVDSLDRTMKQLLSLDDESLATSILTLQIEQLPEPPRVL